MAERSQFWQTGTTGDGATTITEAQTVEWFRDLTTPRSDSNAPSTTMGPLRGVLGELAVSGTSSPVSVAAGACSAEGYYYKNTAAVNVTIPTPTSATRVDRIVIRVSHSTTRTARITRIAGTEGAGAPALTQTAGTTWDIPLAQVSITTGGVITVTDQRTFAQFATNHVKRDGDTMTGNLTVPVLTASTSLTTPAATITAATVTALNGGTAWTSANDGEGSGLDADLVAGVNIAPLQRQGGSATDWSVLGSNNYAPDGWIIQAGKTDTMTGGSRTITFPVAFEDKPIVLLSIGDIGTGVSISIDALSATQVTIRTYIGSTQTACADVSWIAIGPT